MTFNMGPNLLSGRQAVEFIRHIQNRPISTGGRTPSKWRRRLVALLPFADDDRTTELSRWQRLADDLLYNRRGRYPRLVSLCETAEASTGLPREHLAYGVLAVYSLYLVVGYFSELVCNFTGFAYPAYCSFQAIRSPGKEDDTEWLTYWCVFACFTLLDFFSEPIMRVVPLYWLTKCVFLVWLYAPPSRGAARLYDSVVAPTMTQIEAWLNGDDQLQ